MSDYQPGEDTDDPLMVYLNAVAAEASGLMGGLRLTPRDVRVSAATVLDTLQSHDKRVAAQALLDLEGTAPEQANGDTDCFEYHVAEWIHHNGCANQIESSGTEAQLDDECGSCGEGIPTKECPKSKRPCGHHCNHVWTHDACDWCGVEFGEEGKETHPTTSGEGTPL